MFGDGSFQLKQSVHEILEPGMIGKGGLKRHWGLEMIQTVEYHIKFGFYPV